MPTYSYECRNCSLQFEKMVPLSEYKAPQACDSCGSSDTQKILTAVGLNFSGDNWTSKNLRVQKQMREKNKRLAIKERDFKHDGGVPRLVPNVSGEQTSSWSDAAKLARSKGKDTTGYDKLARKEKSA